MRVKPTLSPTTTATQRWAPAAKAEFRTGERAPATIPVRIAKKGSSFVVLITCVTKPLRISLPVIASHTVLKGRKSVLRALRDVELETGNANSGLPAI